MSSRFSKAGMLALLASVCAFPLHAHAQGKDRADILANESERMIANSDMAMTPMAALDPSGELTALMQMKDGQSVSLMDALRWSYEHNPTLRAARSELLATQERLPQAQAGFKPNAEATADATWIDQERDGSDDDAFEKSIGVNASQPIYRGGRTVSGIGSAKNAIMAQRAFLMASEQDIMLQVVTAYMNAIRDQSLYGLAVNNRAVIQKQLDATKARFEVGDVTRTDVSQSESRLAGAEANVTGTLGSLRSSLAVLQRLTGLPPGQLSSPAGVDVSLPDTQNKAEDMAEQYNPAVIAAEFLEFSSEQDISTVFGELLPEVGFLASWNRSYDGLSSDETTTGAIGISATIPLYEAGATRSRVRAARHASSQRRIEVTEARRLARQQAVSSWANLQSAQAEIVSRKAQVEAARIARDGVYKEAELGTRTILDSLDADQELLDAESALVTAQRNDVVARFTLASTVGLMTPDGLGFPELKRDYNAHIDEITGKVFSTRTAFGEDLVEGSDGARAGSAQQ